MNLLPLRGGLPSHFVFSKGGLVTKHLMIGENAPQALLPGVVQRGRSQIEIDEVVFLTKLDWVSYFFLKIPSPLNPLNQ